MAIAANFNLAPEKAVEFFRGKGLSASFAWQDMLHEEHDRAFTVAKMMDLDLLADVKAQVDRAISEGLTRRQFIDELMPTLIARGWWGRQEVTDPATGETVEAQLGSARRLKTIYDTNLRTSYAAGHWARIEANKKTAPYVMYSAILDGRTRPAHAGWNGKVLRADDEWWKTHTPPNGWNCRCTVIQLSERDLERMGKSGPDEAPTGGTRAWENPRTGEVLQVPAGVDPGWGYAPGSSRRAELARAAGEKIIDRPADLGAAFFASTPDLLPGIEESFAAFVDVAVAAERAERRHAIVGAISAEELAFLAARGEPLPQSAEIMVSDQLLVGKKTERYARKNVELTVDEWKSLPAALAAEREALYDTVEKSLVYLLPAETDPRSTRIVVRPGYLVKKQPGEVNVVRSAAKVNRRNIDEAVKSGRYVAVGGKK